MKSRGEGSDEKKIRTDSPLSEKDEVKQAERNTASAFRASLGLKNGLNLKDDRKRRPLL